jgi:hypothetical protein
MIGRLETTVLGMRVDEDDDWQRAPRPPLASSRRGPASPADHPFCLVV